jgi:hypothetical protein
MITIPAPRIKPTSQEIMMAFVSLHIVASGYSRRSRRLAGVIASPTHDNTHPLSVETYEGRFNLAYSFPRLLFEVFFTSMRPTYRPPRKGLGASSTSSLIGLSDCSAMFPAAASHCASSRHPESRRSRCAADSTSSISKKVRTPIPRQYDPRARRSRADTASL